MSKNNKNKGNSPLHWFAREVQRTARRKHAEGHAEWKSTISAAKHFCDGRNIDLSKYMRKFADDPDAVALLVKFKEIMKTDGGTADISVLHEPLTGAVEVQANNDAEDAQKSGHSTVMEIARGDAQEAEEVGGIVIAQDEAQGQDPVKIVLVAGKREEVKIRPVVVKEAELQASAYRRVPISSLYESEAGNFFPIDEKDYAAVKENIVANGLSPCMPITVEGQAYGTFKIVDGHTRYRAALELGIEYVYVVVVSFQTSEERTMFIVMSHLARRDSSDPVLLRAAGILIPIEEERASHRRGRKAGEKNNASNEAEFSSSSKAVGLLLNRSKSTVDRMKRVLLDVEMKAAVLSGKISISAAYNRLALADKEADEKSGDEEPADGTSDEKAGEDTGDTEGETLSDDKPKTEIAGAGSKPKKKKKSKTKKNSEGKETPGHGSQSTDNREPETDDAEAFEPEDVVAVTAEILEFLMRYLNKEHYNGLKILLNGCGIRARDIMERAMAGGVTAE